MSSEASESSEAHESAEAVAIRHEGGMERYWVMAALFANHAEIDIVRWRAAPFGFLKVLSSERFVSLGGQLLRLVAVL